MVCSDSTIVGGVEGCRESLLWNEMMSLDSGMRRMPIADDNRRRIRGERHFFFTFDPLTIHFKCGTLLAKKHHAEFLDTPR